MKSQLSILPTKNDIEKIRGGFNMTPPPPRSVRVKPSWELWKNLSSWGKDRHHNSPMKKLLWKIQKKYSYAVGMTSPCLQIAPRD